ncbi:sporulation protein YunB [Anaerosalibacter sp. Marseille-P3206]|uniref:sporulation protein YunB n=1 Tax=Anaerosalibacter sp. Marseille-P3206 TaxID=1871005 RepID=UPI0009877BF4|nr:sporulation protein YunB [Anaerosalibacter sp. Marseille-P3206]
MKHKFRGKKLILSLVSIIIFLIYIFIFINKNIKPTILAVSEIRVKSVATQAINDSVSSKLFDDIDYTDLIFVKYDETGRVVLMQANTILMNSMASEVANEVQNQMKKIAQSDIKIPLNNAFDIQIMTLPSIKLKMIPQGAVSVDFATEFEESGINQTRHRIYLIVEAEIKMIVPLISENIKVTSNIPIAETIIVGEVPSQYVNVPKEGILNIVE